MHVAIRVIPTVLLLAGLLLPAYAGDSKPLSPEEKLFIHAAALMVVDPAKQDDLLARAEESARQAKPKWAARKDRLLRGLAAIETNPDLREKYRASLKRKLGNDKQANTKKVVQKIARDFEKEKVTEYHEKLNVKDVVIGSVPWPACIPFRCCDD